MPKTSEMKDSKFLRKEDVGEGALLTVTGCEQQNVAPAGAAQELKWCLTFSETEKPLVLNSTNIQLCEQIFQSDDTDAWLGKKLVAYTDHGISYAGKVVGGIRVRAPKVKAKAASKPAPVTVDGEDEIPF